MLQQRELMMKKLLASVAMILTAVSGVTPAIAQTGSSYTLYTTIYYDTPSFDNQVGVLRGQCGRNGPRYTLTGIQTPYSEEFEVGTCGEGGLEPL
jgi:hypothetical protein